MDGVAASRRMGSKGLRQSIGYFNVRLWDWVATWAWLLSQGHSSSLVSNPDISQNPMDVIRKRVADPIMPKSFRKKYFQLDFQLPTGEKGKGIPLRWNQQQFTRQPGPEDKPTQFIKEFKYPCYLNKQCHVLPERIKQAIFQHIILLDFPLFCCCWPLLHC